MIATQINHEVIKLWEKQYADDADVWIPAVYPPLHTKGILFIGLNPSFSEQGFPRFLAGSPYADLNPREFYHWRNRQRFDLQKAIAIEVLAKQKYRFFTKFKEIAKELASTWEHIDLFFNRQTEQLNACTQPNVN